ncbi:MAG: ABC transporter permease [Candidatus Limnocylindrales bacterium]|jgi:ABC-2 type transport system permease protein
MSGFGLLLRKELLEQTRTMRLYVVAIVFALFAIVSPLTAKYLPDIVKALAGNQVSLAGLISTPTVGDAVDQFLKNLTQFGVLIAILLAMGTVAGEKDRGTAAFILTKPVSRGAFLAAKLVAISVTLLVSTAVAGILGYYYTAVLFEPLPAAGYAAMCGLLWLSLVVFAALTFLGSTLTSSAAAGAGIGVGFLVATGIVSALPTVGRYMPEMLAGPARSLALGQASADVVGPVAVNVAITLAAGGLAWLAFRRQEL